MVPQIMPTSTVPWMFIISILSVTPTCAQVARESTCHQCPEGVGGDGHRNESVELRRLSLGGPSPTVLVLNYMESFGSVFRAHT